jgi:hypothetical protein
VRLLRRVAVLLKLLLPAAAPEEERSGGEKEPVRSRFRLPGRMPESCNVSYRI